jgi:hypothetical protein
MIEGIGGFILVYVSTPLEVCEQRDRKGLYAKARAGLLPRFTGVSDPYEAPADADIVIDTRIESAEQAACRVIDHLRMRGFLVEPQSPHPGSTHPYALHPNEARYPAETVQPDGGVRANGGVHPNGAVHGDEAVRGIEPSRQPDCAFTGGAI